MKKNDRSIKKVIKNRIELQLGQKHASNKKVVKKQETKMNERHKLRIDGTPSPKHMSVGLVGRKAIRSGIPNKIDKYGEEPVLEFAAGKEFEHVIVTPFYLRKNILEIFCEKIKELQEHHDIHVILIGSNSFENEKQFVQSYGFDYLYHPNRPLSNKWNYGVLALKQLKFKKLVVLGSDDIISSNLFKRLSENIDYGCDMTGVLDIYFHDLEKNKTYYWSGYNSKSPRFKESVGAGRFYSSKLIEEFKYMLWNNNLNSGLDRNVSGKLKNKKVVVSKMLDDEFLIDIKNTKTQISKLSDFKDSMRLKQLKYDFKYIK